jgi:hypothetical protein
LPHMSAVDEHRRGIIVIAPSQERPGASISVA